MINLRKAALQIKTDGLFSYIYDELKEESGGEELSEDQIRQLLKQSPNAQKHLDKYRQLNRESEISNIHLKELIINESDELKCKEMKEKINENANRLRALEKYGASAKDSAYSIWIGSLAVFIIFLIHNYFGLFTNVYKTYPIIIFGSYLLVIVWAFRFYFKTMKNHDAKHRLYKNIYTETQKLIQQGLKSDCFLKKDIFD